MASTGGIAAYHDDPIEVPLLQEDPIEDPPQLYERAQEVVSKVREQWMHLCGFRRDPNTGEWAASGPRPEGQRWCPEEHTSILSRIFFFYMNSLMNVGSRKHLEQNDLWDLSDHQKASGLYAKYKAAMEETAVAKKHPYGSVGRALFKSFGGLWMFAGVLKFAHDCFNLAAPYFLQQLLKKIQSNDEGARFEGLGWALGMFTCGLMVALLITQHFLRIYKVSLNIKAALVQFIYDKSLKISLRGKAALGTGVINNLQSNDAAKIWNIPQYGHILWSAPFQVFVIMYALHQIIGLIPALAGVLAMVLVAPISMLLGSLVHMYRLDLIAKTDARVKIMTEVINGIKAIKLYAWEEPYEQRVQAARTAERRSIFNMQLVNGANMLMFTGAPILVAMAAFGTYSWQGKQLTADVAFPALAYFDLLRFPLLMLPWQIIEFISARVALTRLQRFVDSEEADVLSAWEAQVLAESAAEEGNMEAVAMVQGTYAWDPLREPNLIDVTFSVPHGALCIVVGAVGSGKSSLLAALLGEMPCVRGSALARGTVALTTQDPWIQNATVRDNVLMGLPFDEVKYDEVVEACALHADLDSLPAGDATEIGEKGVTLSGGQKHRIALARACYVGADVVLLDDPLSAVDAHVGRHLMQHAICGTLASATRVLVTHQLQFLPDADLVIKLEKGRITAAGTYDELVARGVELEEISMEGGEEGDEEVEEGEEGAGAVNASGEVKESQDGAKKNEQKPEKTAVSKVEAPPREEERQRGSVTRSMYMTYIRAWGPGLLLPITYLIISLFGKSLEAMQNYWLSLWSNAVVQWQDSVPAGHDPENPFPVVHYMLWYFGIGFVAIGIQFFSSFILVIATLNASQVLHDKLLAKVLSLPMSFFDTQPSGRLIARFTHDVETTDIDLQDTIQSFVMCFAAVIVALVVVAAVTKGFVLLALAPLIPVYLSVQSYYLATSRELNRLNSVAQSPIFTNFSETLSGLMTVRAFRKQDQFLDKNEKLLDASSRSWWPIQVANRWLSIRLELTGQTIILTTAVFASLFVSNSGLAGLALTSAMSMVGLLNWATRMGSEMEMGMNSVERMSEYLKYKSEAPPVIDENRPKPGWPQHGSIIVKDLVVRYRADLPAVLKGLSFDVAPAQKVGICGRTGCGKSTFMLALYRIVEPTGGSIEIDGVDVTKIGLRDLRSRLSLVPQDPVVFSGSVRSNLDPFNRHTDAEVQASLQQSGLEEWVQSLSEGADTELQEGGSNLSVGQRQLLCMARALLKKARILLMDEATSNVDNTTDSLIQHTIRSAFTHCTILTIAHRLHTIIDSERILVLDAGELVEYGKPGELMKKPDSKFRALVNETSAASRAGGSAAKAASGIHASASAAALADEMTQ